MSKESVAGVLRFSEVAPSSRVYNRQEQNAIFGFAGDGGPTSQAATRPCIRLRTHWQKIIERREASRSAGL